MTKSAMVFFIIGAVVLWGGLLCTLAIAIKNERASK
ncbi:MetS family NSS transporter small subunit [Clostridium aestuarii]|uniref:MetS family NSS transporter small subunit n=1 Tax=Clostridium aestuarii TaxID=338193 RepID=A0ABT4CX79_9CLOT|nr:MetS family NSS transporter small subunit [Clostridium aestuarii]MCY6483604.1 MetS family NSS transporter small subunit [Clostridium aestuarii]